MCPQLLCVCVCIYETYVGTFQYLKQHAHCSTNCDNRKYALSTSN